MKAYPENLLTWRPVFDWLTLLDVHGELHAVQLENRIRQCEQWGSPWEHTTRILELLEREKKWLAPTKCHPTKEQQFFGIGGQLPKCKKGKQTTATAHPAMFFWGPGENFEQLQEFIRTEKPVGVVPEKVNFLALHI